MNFLMKSVALRARLDFRSFPECVLVGRRQILGDDFTEGHNLKYFRCWILNGFKYFLTSSIICDIIFM